MSSQLERKNPFGLINAFRRAFAARRDVVLALKFTNAEYDRREVERLQKATEGLRVVLLEGYMARDELAGLMQAADCYVSLHRSEGFGLDDRGSHGARKAGHRDRLLGQRRLHDCRRTAIQSDIASCRFERDHGPYLRGFVWAEPDLDQPSS